MRQPARFTNGLYIHTRARFWLRRRLPILACDASAPRSLVIRQVRYHLRQAVDSARGVHSPPGVARRKLQSSGSSNRGIGLPATSRRISEPPRERPERGTSRNPAFVMIGRSTGSFVSAL